MDNQIATEALLQRGRTPLYNDLVSLYQETHDALRELGNASPAKYNLKLKSIDYPGRLKSIIFKHTGFNIVALDLIESKAARASSSIRLSQKKRFELNAGIGHSGDILAKIRHIYDPKSGRTSVTDYDEFGFVFAITMGFWRFRNPDQSFFFTAEELTAVTLHEVGHFDHWVQTLVEPYARLHDISDVISYIDQRQDNKTILVAIDHLRKSKRLHRSWKDVTELLYRYFKDNPQSSDANYRNAIDTLEIVIAAEQSDYQLARLNVALLQDGVKINDQLMRTAGIEEDAEISADDYAARHGAYSNLVSTRIKSERLPDNMYSLHMVEYDSDLSTTIFAMFDGFKSIVHIDAFDVGNGYERLIRRLEIIVQTAKHAFSQSDLTSNQIKYIKSEITKAEDAIARYKSSKKNAVGQTIRTWIDTTISLGRIVAAPARNRLAGDYHKLQQDTRDLSRHSLYYLAKK